MGYRSRESYISKDPVKRARQLSGLKQYHKPNLGEYTEAHRVGPEGFPDDIIGFCEAHFYIPETKAPIKLLAWQRKVLQDIFYTKVWPSLAVCGSVKKSGKSALAAAVCQWYLLNVPMCEGYVLAPDLDAGKDIIFRSLVKSIRMHPVLRKKCIIRKDIIEYGDNFIKVLPNDLSVSGLRPTLTVIDEPWQFRTEQSIRVLDEMTTNPVGHHLTYTTGYAGYQEDQTEELHLWRWYSRGRSIQEGKEEPDPSFYFYWKEDYSGVPWVEGTNYLDNQRKSLRPTTYERFHENKWSSSSESFITADVLDLCIDPSHRRGLPFDGPVVGAIDCGLKRDTSAIVLCGAKNGRVILIDHCIFVPTPGITLDIEETIEQTVRIFANQYNLISLLYDPWQMERTGQLLCKAGINAKEFPQTVPNTVMASENLHSLLTSGLITLYPDKQLRSHILAASARETERGFRIVKLSQSRHVKIDGCVALSMAALEAKNRLVFQRKAGLYIPPDDDDDDDGWRLESVADWPDDVWQRR